MNNVTLLVACAVALVTFGCANSEPGSNTTDRSLNRNDTGVGDGGLGGSGVSNGGPGGASSIGSGNGRGGGY